MATFVYDALDPVGRSVKGRVDADSESLVLSKLHDQNFHVLSVSEAKGMSLSFKRGVGSPKLQSLVVFSRQFATMIDAGISILKCLDILEGQTKDPALKGALVLVRKDVKGGLSLGDALAKHPNCFSKLYVNMIRAAELGGILDTILDRLATFLEKRWRSATRSRAP
jgi:type IV pilus assembly protein PilC